MAKELGKTVSPEGTGTKNRFGYVPTSPATPVEVKETVKPKAFTVDLSADDARQAGRGQSSKDLIKNLTCADRSESPPLQAPSRTVECGGLAMTIAWTPPKNVKKPVLAERKPAASKRSLEKVPALVSKPSIACPKSKTVPKQVAVGKAMGIKSAACKVRQTWVCTHRHANAFHLGTSLMAAFLNWLRSVLGVATSRLRKRRPSR